ncbi:MAG TPA: hypothetical protein VNJ07_05755 [Chitinophagales bacterium]|nr:hypothetical protein [Chitinophagales bacterium]
MKNLMLLSAILLNNVLVYAAKLTVDNSPGSAAQYNNVQSAITAASNGDTLLVYGSAYTYAAFTVDKKLTIIGSAGFDPEVTNEYRPTVNNISLSTNSSGTVISGFNIGYVQAYSTTVDNIGIYNNYFNSTTTGIQWYSATCNNWVIEGNVFQASGQNNFIDNYSNTSTLNNILIKNNYFEMSAYYYYVSNYNNSSFTYRNNIFVIRSNNNAYPMCYQCNSVLYENNIFWMTDAAYTDITAQNCTSCVFNNNIIYNSSGATMTAIGSIGNGVSGANNIMNQDPQFVNFNVANGYTISENYQISNASPGNNAGTDGMDIGLFGGNYNWENRKYPKTFPHQEVLNVINGSVPQGTPVNVNLKARKATN